MNRDRATIKTRDTNVMSGIDKHITTTVEKKAVTGSVVGIKVTPIVAGAPVPGPLAYPPVPSFGYCVSMNRQNRALNLRRFSGTSNHVRCKAPSVATIGYHVSRRVGSELLSQRSTTVSRKF